MQVDPGTIVVYSDLACPWAHLAVYRLLTRRRVLGLDGRVVLDHRAFPLELVNSRPTPKNVLDAEIPVAAGLDPDAGWQVWQGPEAHYPVSTLLALEAVQAAKEQGLRASERLDRALRRAFFGESRCITMRHEILDIARRSESVDADTLADALDSGRARGAVIAHWRGAEPEDAEVSGSPHVFLPDGTDEANPGLSTHWNGDRGLGFPVVDHDDPSIYDQLLTRAAGS